MKTPPTVNTPTDEAVSPLLLEDVMNRDVVTISMDATLGAAMEICANRRIRHLPVVDEKERLVGVVTDRDLRYFVSPRVGTLWENNNDRETLSRRVHIMMMRRVVVGQPQMSVSEAVGLMLENRVGCLPVVDKECHAVGIVSTSDFLKLLARFARKPPH